MNQLVQLEWRMQNYTQSHLLFKKKKSLQLFSSLNTLPLTLHSNQILLSTIRNKQQQFHSNYLKETNYFFKKMYTIYQSPFGSTGEVQAHLPTYMFEIVHDKQAQIILKNTNLKFTLNCKLIYND